MGYFEERLVDADAADWITVVAYLVGALFSWHAARSAASHGQQRERVFWLASVGAMVFFAVNEVFDFQMLLTALAKIQARDAGWYENRRFVQYAFVIALGVLALVLVAATFVLVRSLARAIKLAVAGYIFIAIFVLFRAASFHHLDQLLGRGYHAFNFGSIQEMAGILVVALAAYLYTRGHRKREPGAG